MSLKEQEPIIIVGAGWAGLSAALTLSRQGKKIILLEAAPQAGGRARRVFFGEDRVDNGQHLLLGAYRHILTTLEWLKIPEKTCLHRVPLELWIADLHQQNRSFHLKNVKFCSPLQQLASLFHLKGLTWKERFKMAHFFHAIQNNLFELDAKTDISIEKFLYSFNQPKSLIKKLWAPIAIAALTTPIHEASAQVFLQVLKDTFCKNKENSDLLFPKKDLSELLPDPILQHLKNHNNFIFYNQRIKGLIVENGECKGVYTAAEQFKGQSVILATPPQVSAQLIQQSPATTLCKTLIDQLLKFQYQPITTVYLRYPKAIELNFPMIGFINSTIHWIFDRSLTGHPNILSVVISAEDPHTQLAHPQLVEKITKELASHFLAFKQTPIDYRVIREKRAAFSCHVGVNAYRPENITPLTNLWLAGDYTQTYYPATLEGAVQSGMQTAQLILS